ncbi:hypothetical protein EV356DRAFT_527895 [Viridothelium virens]|uniref:Uncharacterized protein n=1 Tax=Viridothelium virens TaxID=1048519 RepID=A0A6A6HPI1_VIRVR|nr:hypothetical protein EV356DRAFT_527895 [Viridothelium virens]
MFAIQKSSANTNTCTPNLLPCRINHNGATDAKERYWKPRTEEDGTQTAYFRGRKLRGKQVKLPHDYQGALLTKTEKLVPTQQPHNPPMDVDELEQDEDDDLPDQAKIAEASRPFDKIVVWGHDSLPDPATNPHIRGIEEWISFAEKMHRHTKQGEAAGDKTNRV